MPQLPPPPVAPDPGTSDAADVGASGTGPIRRRTPRPGELTTAWRWALAGVWCGVAVGFAAIWNASAQLGLATWWLGPRSDPQPELIRLAPFVPAVLMVIAALNHARWLCWWGLGAAALLGLLAVGNVDRVATLAAVEFAVAGAAGVASVAALAGTYRRIEPPATASSDSD